MAGIALGAGLVACCSAKTSSTTSKLDQRQLVGHGREEDLLRCTSYKMLEYYDCKSQIIVITGERKRQRKRKKR